LFSAATFLASSNGTPLHCPVEAGGGLNGIVLLLPGCCLFVRGFWLRWRPTAGRMPELLIHFGGFYRSLQGKLLLPLDNLLAELALRSSSDSCSVEQAPNDLDSNLRQVRDVQPWQSNCFCSPHRPNTVICLNRNGSAPRSIAMILFF
jgi:hypothetical protein